MIIAERFQKTNSELRPDTFTAALLGGQAPAQAAVEKMFNKVLMAGQDDRPGRSRWLGERAKPPKPIEKKSINF